MLIPPKYFLSPKISELLSQIEACRAVVDTIQIPPAIEQNIRRASALKSSLFSARIEGNTATLEELALLAPKDRKKIEISNILRAVNWIGERSKKALAIRDILILHSLAMKGIDTYELGKFRTRHEGIFTSAGIVVYHAPPPSQIESIIKKLLRYANSGKEQFVPIKAALIHYVFEKVHPFTDGSGRVGRLLMLTVLAKNGYGFKGVLPFEEKIDKKRETYYKLLEEPERDVTNYLEFMLEVLTEAAYEAKEKVLETKKVSRIDFILPRRAELVRIIKEQKIISFGQIKRRFPEINQRTLRHDLKKLQESGFVRKLGSTKGAHYSFVAE